MNDYSTTDDPSFLSNPSLPPPPLTTLTMKFSVAPLAFALFAASSALAQSVSSSSMASSSSAAPSSSSSAAASSTAAPSSSAGGDSGSGSSMSACQALPGYEEGKPLIPNYGCIYNTTRCVEPVALLTTTQHILTSTIPPAAPPLTTRPSSSRTSSALTPVALKARPFRTWPQSLLSLVSTITSRAKMLPPCSRADSSPSPPRTQSRSSTLPSRPPSRTLLPATSRPSRPPSRASPLATSRSTAPSPSTPTRSTPSPPPLLPSSPVVPSPFKQASSALTPSLR